MNSQVQAVFDPLLNPHQDNPFSERQRTSSTIPSDSTDTSKLKSKTDFFSTTQPFQDPQKGLFSQPVYNAAIFQDNLQSAPPRPKVVAKSSSHAEQETPSQISPKADNIAADTININDSLFGTHAESDACTNSHQYDDLYIPQGALGTSGQTESVQAVEADLLFAPSTLVETTILDNKLTNSNDDSEQLFQSSSEQVDDDLFSNLDSDGKDSNIDNTFNFSDYISKQRNSSNADLF